MEVTPALVSCAHRPAVGKDQEELGTETPGTRDGTNSPARSQRGESFTKPAEGEERRTLGPTAAREQGLASDQLPPRTPAPGPCACPAHCTAGELQARLLALESALATGEAAEPFLELLVGLGSLHGRTARLLAARASDRVSSLRW